jgi:hypothetical protein
MDNILCGGCDHTFFVPKYSVSIKNHQTIYSDRFGQIVCPACGSHDISIITDGAICTNIGNYSSASWDEKKKILQKRAKKAMRKDAEQRYEIDKHFRGHVNEKHY